MIAATNRRATKLVTSPGLMRREACTGGVLLKKCRARLRDFCSGRTERRLVRCAAGRVTLWLPAWGERRTTTRNRRREARAMRGS